MFHLRNPESMRRLGFASSPAVQIRRRQDRGAGPTPHLRLTRTRCPRRAVDSQPSASQLPFNAPAGPAARGQVDRVRLVAVPLARRVMIGTEQRPYSSAAGSCLRLRVCSLSAAAGCQSESRRANLNRATVRVTVTVTPRLPVPSLPPSLRRQGARCLTRTASSRQRCANADSRAGA
jgi:hypothetical protein